MRWNPSTKATVVAALTTASLLGGCAGQKFGYAGENLWERYPLDGTTREWEYVNEDTAVEYVLVVEKVSETLQGGKALVTLSYTARAADTATGESGETLLHEVVWSTDSDDGVEIWSWTDYTADVAGVTTDYSPPVIFAEREMNNGDMVDSDSAGVSFTSQYNGLQDCPNNWSGDTWECARVAITGGTGAEPFLGEHWVAMNYGTSWFEPEAGGKWVLSKSTYADTSAD